VNIIMMTYSSYSNTKAVIPNNSLTVTPKDED